MRKEEGRKKIEKPRNGTRRYLENWIILNYYQYQIYAVDSGYDYWLEAIPVTPGLVTRIAGSKMVLREILEDDALKVRDFYQKVR